MNDKVFDELKDLITEGVNPLSSNLDQMSTMEILKLMNSEDKTVPLAVEGEIPYIAKAVEMIIKVFRSDGRLFYAGAGTSGRLGVLDASECPPTFGIPRTVVQGVIAGGTTALYRSRERMEDYEENGRNALLKGGVTKNDVVCGITASKRTPFVVGAIKYAREIGAKTIFITCNPRKTVAIKADVIICPVPGPEILMGSTRMKAGTATKLVLNMLTTTAMIRLGKTYGNLMVDLKGKARKLQERSKKIIMMVTGVDYQTATGYLMKSKWHVKTSIIMILADVPAGEAKLLLEKADGFVRKALELNKKG